MLSLDSVLEALHEAGVRTTMRVLKLEIDRGRLQPVVRVGRDVYVPPATLQAYLKLPADWTP